MSAAPHDTSPRGDRARWSMRFRRNRLALSGAVFLALALGLVLMTLPFTARWYDVQDLANAVRHAPTTEPVVPTVTYLARLPEADGVSLRGPAAWAAGAAPWCGFDRLGRSLLFRTLLGWGISLIVGLAAALMAVGIGVLWGATAALAGGRLDALMMRVVDVLYSLPYILLVVLVRVALQRPLSESFGGNDRLANVIMLLLAIGAVSWLTMARVARGQVLSLRTRPFVEAARAGGAGPLRILVHHLLPNLVGPVAVYATLVVPQAILQESFLSFLGLGVQQPVPSLGRLAADGVQAVNHFVGYWWLIVIPCLALVLTLLALNFVGDGLRDALDPKSRITPMI